MHIDTPGQVRPGALRILRRVVRPLSRLFNRPTLEGAEHLPDGPYLLVANHSAGVALCEILAIASLWVERFGETRPLAGFAHVIGFKFPPLRWVHRQIGTIPSTYDAAYAALAKGVPVLVFPGGDHESLRPIWCANRVDFGGRRGFIRIARTAQVPVVPMGIVGSHYTVPILWRSRALAWLLVIPRLAGIKRWAVSLLGLLGCVGLAVTGWPLWVKLLLGWLWLALPVMFTPIVPWTIRMRIGTPMPVVAPDADLDHARDAVQAQIQALVDQLNGR
jgi:1-acyl-sn-glycerol-3-phosphate acyltransferase